MYIVHHGGSCCGVKQVYNLGLDPKAKINGLEAGAQTADGTHRSRVYTKQRQPETGFERLKTYVEYYDRHHSAGVIEVITAEYKAFDWKQYEKWHKPLLELGFVEVTANRNSNSGNIIHIYHRAVDRTPEEQKALIAALDAAAATKSTETSLRG